MYAIALINCGHEHLPQRREFDELHTYVHGGGLHRLAIECHHRPVLFNDTYVHMQWMYNIQIYIPVLWGGATYSHCTRRCP